MLTLDEITERLFADGYVVLRQVLSEAEVRSWSDAIDDLLRRARTSDPDVVPHVTFERDLVRLKPALNDLSAEHVGDAIRMIDDLIAVDPFWWVMFESRSLRDTLHAVLGDPMKFVFAQCVVKEAMVSSMVSWHRDHPSPVLHVSPDPGLRTLICVDAMDARNGATIVLPGSHQPDHPSREMSASEAARVFAADMVTLSCKAGDVIIQHPELLHGGTSNRSDRRRRLVVAGWASGTSEVVDTAGFAGSGRLITHGQRRVWVS